MRALYLSIIHLSVRLSVCISVYQCNGVCNYSPSHYAIVLALSTLPETSCGRLRAVLVANGLGDPPSGTPLALASAASFNQHSAVAGDANERGRLATEVARRFTRGRYARRPRLSDTLNPFGGKWDAPGPEPSTDVRSTFFLRHLSSPAPPLMPIALALSAAEFARLVSLPGFDLARLREVLVTAACVRLL